MYEDFKHFGKRRMRESNLKPYYLLFILLIFLPLFITVWLKNKVYEMGYKISKLEEQINSARIDNDKLKARLAYLKNPKRLEILAKKLGFSAPSPSQVIILKENNSNNGGNE